jgi:dTDP-4-amino-4,6-dideoxy-D-glucose acyltransferase
LKNDFLLPAELAEIGLAQIGREVRISKHALFFAPDRIKIGDYSRIDAFSIISAGGEGVTIGRNVHISAHVTILGNGPVVIGDFVTVSVRCSIFSSSDDYSGATMTNPTVPTAFRGTTDAPVTIEAHAILGAAVTILPGVRIGESACIGAGSLIKFDIPSFSIAVGVPARIIGVRKFDHRRLAEKLLYNEKLR